MVEPQAMLQLLPLREQSSPLIAFGGWGLGCTFVAAETASGVGAHLFRLFASPTGSLVVLAHAEDAGGRPHW